MKLYRTQRAQFHPMSDKPHQLVSCLNMKSTGRELSYLDKDIAIFLGQFCPRRKGAMRLTLCLVPNRETIPDHNADSRLGPENKLKPSCIATQNVYRSCYLLLWAKMPLLLLAHQKNWKICNRPFYWGGHKKDQCTRCFRTNVLVPGPPSRAFSQQERSSSGKRTSNKGNTINIVLHFVQTWMIIALITTYVLQAFISTDYVVYIITYTMIIHAFSHFSAVQINVQIFHIFT